MKVINNKFFITSNSAPSIKILVFNFFGIFIKSKASKTQKSMLQCLSNILLRLPLDWVPEPIGEKAEAELLDWDAEKYRKSLSNE